MLRASLIPSSRVPVRRQVHRLVRRHRRVLAATLAALALVAAVSAVRTPSVVSEAPARDTDSRALRTGEAAVPVMLASAGIAASLTVGDVIDLIRPDGSSATSAARVIGDAPAGTGFSGATPVILVAVREHQALGIAVSPEGGYSVIIHPATR